MHIIVGLITREIARNGHDRRDHQDRQSSCLGRRGRTITFDIKVTVSGVVEDLKFKISEGLDQNWS